MTQYGIPFGTTHKGEEVQELTLDNGVMSCNILTFGAVVRRLTVPGREGPVDVVLGYDTLEQYETEGGYLGAVVGRFANRIAKGKFSLGGKEYQLAVNDGPNHLHGGNTGFSHRVWTVEELTEQRAVLTLDSPDGEEGYPGHLQVKVTYALEGTALSVRYEAVSDQDTPCNLTNHSWQDTKAVPRWSRRLPCLLPNTLRLVRPVFLWAVWNQWRVLLWTCASQFPSAGTSASPFNS